MQALYWIMGVYVLLKMDLGVIGRFKAFPAPPVVCKIHGLTMHSMLEYITERIPEYLKMET